MPDISLQTTSQLAKSNEKSSRQESVWESIMEEFIQLCREAGIDTSNTLVQIKEK